MRREKRTLKEVIKEDLVISQYLEYMGYKYESNGRMRVEGKIVPTHRLLKHDSLVFTDKFFWWNSKIDCNGDIISLAMELEDIEYKESLKLLNKVLKNKDKLNGNCLIKRKPSKGKFYDGHKMEQVINYLVEERKLSEGEVNELIKAKNLIVDENNNARFVVRDYITREIVGYEIIGTTKKRYKRMSENIEYGTGFNIIIGKPKKAYFFESAIDLLSYKQLFDYDMKDVLLVSLGGVKSNILEKAIKDFNIDDVFIATDNDEAGRNFLEEIKETIPHLNIISKIPRRKSIIDWNDALKEYVLDINKN